MFRLVSLRLFLVPVRDIGHPIFGVLLSLSCTAPCLSMHRVCTCVQQLPRAPSLTYEGDHPNPTIPAVRCPTSHLCFRVVRWERAAPIKVFVGSAQKLDFNRFPPPPAVGRGVKALFESAISPFFAGFLGTSIIIVTRRALSQIENILICGCGV